MPDIQLNSDEFMKPSWKDSIYRQREELARMLREPLALLAEKCAPVWSDRDGLNTVLQEGFSSIPYCTYLYIVGTDGVQISDHVSNSGLTIEHYHLNRSERPYMKETMPAWGFLLSDAYVSLNAYRPSLTALQVVVSGAGTIGQLGAEFDLRGLPVISALYQEPHDWRQVKGDPAIRGTLFQQTRSNSPMDRNIENALSILEELLAEPERKVVIFSEWTTMTLLIGKHLSSAAIPFVELTGKVPVKKRQALIDEFKDIIDSLIKS